jgi:UDP-3-O-[3-hydroxymyristoyl] glucosamine N-acyltransferase
MKIKNPFFVKREYIYLADLMNLLNVKYSDKKKIKIENIQDLSDASKNDISFFNSLKYQKILKHSKAKYIITSAKYEDQVKLYSNPIIVKDVLKSVYSIIKIFYENSLNDAVDLNVSNPNKEIFNNVTFGKNVLLGKNVKIGKNTLIGHNTIIESNVVLGSNCIIGNNILIKNSIIGNDVRILDGSVIGKKGFGFLPNQNKNVRYPHIGMVIIEDNVEIGSNNTIDRGSISNTYIGKNSFLDNQVHIAHNVRIGKNCIITGQVGLAGSCVVGDFVQIGGQAGISGHLKIGNNVKIGGGSGVIKDIPENTNVMGYPAKNIRSFLKKSKNGR